MVRAKFKCDEVAKTAWGGCTLRFYPVTGGGQENEQFFKATPSGKLELSVVKAEVADKFEPGKEYYLDFTPAEDS